LCEWLSGPTFRTPAGQEVAYAIMKAVVAHLYLAWIHPFGDGNGRTARLLEFQILLEAGVPQPAAHLLSNHYNQTRVEYYRQLNLSSKTGGEVVPFLLYAVRGFVDQLREQLEYIWTQQWDLAWRIHVDSLYPTLASISERRQRDIALDLPAQGNWVPIAAIPDLSPRLARGFAGKTPKTLQRDLGALERLGLIEREARRVRARREIIFSFLPLRHRPGSSESESKG
jgi:hypothetical protein